MPRRRRRGRRRESRRGSRAAPFARESWNRSSIGYRILFRRFGTDTARHGSSGRKAAHEERHDSPEQTSGYHDRFKSQPHGYRERRGSAKRRQQAGQGRFANPYAPLGYRQERGQLGQRPGKKPHTERNMESHDFSQPAVDGDLGYLQEHPETETEDRKSTRLNSSHLGISYAVFC